MAQIQVRRRAIGRRTLALIPALALALALLGAMISRPAAAADAAVDRATVEAASHKVFPALVRIHVVEAYYRSGRERKSEASGSGFIISPDGYVVTNHHVAGDAVRLVCTMADREEIPARLIGSDAMADIAVIKLEPEKPRTFPFVQWGDSDALRVGDPVLAMGSPLALSQSVTEGIVSNTALTIPRWDGDFQLDGENVGSIVRWIAHDASIFPGNSGGPLVDLNGGVVGVNEISIGLAGAIPGGLARSVAEQLIKSGEIRRAFFGFQLQPLFKQDEKQRGVLVADSVKDSPSEKAGIQSGDRIVRIVPEEGKAVDIDVHFAEQLPPLNLALSEMPIGKPAKVTLIRDGKELTLDVTPVVRDKVLRKQREFQQWGMTGRDLSTWTALEKKRPDTDGVVVTSVRPGGPLGQAKPSIDPGDVILKVGGKTIKDMQALTSLTQELTGGKDEEVPVLVEYDRDGQLLMTQVSVGLEELNDPGRDVRKAWIPVDTQVLTRELAKGLGIPDKSGVRVTELYADKGSSPTLGLQVGDIVTKLDDTSIDASDERDVEVFPTMVRQYPIGSEVTLSVLRDGKPTELKGTLSMRPPESREMKRYLDHDFNFTVRDTAYLDYVRKQWDDRPKGAYVESVEEGGWTALAGLQPGDLLMAIDGKPVSDSEDVREQLEAVKKAKPKSVILKVRRGLGAVYLEVEPIWEGTS